MCWVNIGVSMSQKFSALYRKAATEFAHRVASTLGDKIGSIILYGSTARGEARRDSDIDILLISQQPEAIRQQISEICSDLTYEYNYSFLISLVHFSREEFYRLRQVGSPFMANVVNEGGVLHDDGTFSGVREKATADSR